MTVAQCPRVRVGQPTGIGQVLTHHHTTVPGKPSPGPLSGFSASTSLSYLSSLSSAQPTEIHNDRSLNHATSTRHHRLLCARHLRRVQVIVANSSELIERVITHAHELFCARYGVSVQED